MKKIIFSRPAITVNEDTFFVGEDFGFVLDGATGLLKENISPKPSDAQWFVLKISEILQKTILMDLSLNEIVANAIKQADQEYMSFEGAQNIKSKPSSGIALYRKRNETLEYFLLGDVSLLVELKDGTIKEFLMQELPKLDGENIQKMAQIAKEKGIHVIDARPLINDDLLRVRLSQNTPHGYYILGDNPEAAKHALSGSIPLHQVKSITALSDGYSQTYDTFDLFKEPKQLIEKLETTTPEEIYEQLWQLQEQDYYCDEHPRFKIRDDATIIHVVL